MLIGELRASSCHFLRCHESPSGRQNRFSQTERRQGHSDWFRFANESEVTLLVYPSSSAVHTSCDDRDEEAFDIFVGPLCCPIGIFPTEIRVAFHKESQLQQSRATQA